MKHLKVKLFIGNGFLFFVACDNGDDAPRQL
jgi:hypothetical protein